MSIVISIDQGKFIHPFLSTGALGNCSQFVDHSPYQTACVYDLCHTQPDNDIICDAVEQFIRTCHEASHGTIEIGNWRELLPRCSMSSITYIKYMML